MLDHFEDYWWLYLILLPCAFFMYVVIDTSIDENAQRNACVTAGKMAATAYGGSIYCVDPRALAKP